MKRLIYFLFLLLLCVACKKEHLGTDIQDNNGSTSNDTNDTVPYYCIETFPSVMNFFDDYDIEYSAPKALNYEEVGNSLINKLSINAIYVDGHGTIRIHADRSGETSFRLYNDDWDTIMPIRVIDTVTPYRVPTEFTIDNSSSSHMLSYLGEHELIPEVETPDIIEITDSYFSHEVGTAGKGMILIKGLNIGDASIHLSNNEWDDHVTIHVIDEE